MLRRMAYFYYNFNHVVYVRMHSLCSFGVTNRNTEQIDDD